MLVQHGSTHLVCTYFSSETNEISLVSGDIQLEIASPILPGTRQEQKHWLNTKPDPDDGGS